ncbi:MAG: MFS transporter [Deltaproteobacteria bacterium]|nr:MFS transporter [Deltaproteobacteria bacterium]
MKPRFSFSPASQVLLLTWLFFGMYYLNRFNYSAVIPLVRADLGISNAQAGGLMAFFFLTYTVFQLPSGYLGDRFGPRKVLTLGALVSIAGNLIFSRGSTFPVLALGQLINGFGQAMGWNSALKLVVSWFPRARRGTVIGLFATCITGGSSVGIRVSGLIGDRIGWRSSFVIPPAMMAVVAVVFWIVVRDRPRDRGLQDFDDEIHIERLIDSDPRSTLSVVLTHGTLWVVAMVYFCLVYVQFGSLVWIPSFLKEGYGMSVDRASTVSFLVLLPGVLASPVAGFVSDFWFGGRRKPLILVGLLVLSASAFLLSLTVGLTLATLLLALLGLMILVPDILLAAYPSDLLSRRLSATGMGFLATFTSAAGILTTPVSGKIVDSFHSYGALFFSFGAVALLGAFLALFIREKESPGVVQGN